MLNSEIASSEAAHLPIVIVAEAGRRLSAGQELHVLRLDAVLIVMFAGQCLRGGWGHGISERCPGDQV